MALELKIGASKKLSITINDSEGSPVDLDGDLFNKARVEVISQFTKKIIQKWSTDATDYGGDYKRAYVNTTTNKLILYIDASDTEDEKPTDLTIRSDVFLNSDDGDEGGNYEDDLRVIRKKGNLGRLISSR